MLHGSAAASFSLAGSDKEEELEVECLLTAAQYRRLWLDEAHALGQVAETLAESLGWQGSDDQPLPDALELAQVAARRLAMLERSLALYQPRLTARMAAKEFA